MDKIIKTLNFTKVEFFVTVENGESSRQVTTLNRSLTEGQALRYLKEVYPHLNISAARIMGKYKKTYVIEIDDFIKYSNEIGELQNE